MQAILNSVYCGNSCPSAWNDGWCWGCLQPWLQESCSQGHTSGTADLLLLNQLSTPGDVSGKRDRMAPAEKDYVPKQLRDLGGVEG